MHKLDWYWHRSPTMSKIREQISMSNSPSSFLVKLWNKWLAFTSVCGISRCWSPRFVPIEFCASFAILTSSVMGALANPVNLTMGQWVKKKESEFTTSGNKHQSLLFQFYNGDAVDERKSPMQCTRFGGLHDELTWKKYSLKYLVPNVFVHTRIMDVIWL